MMEAPESHLPLPNETELTLERGKSRTSDHRENGWMDERAFAMFILPLILSNVFQQLYVPVNAAVVGRFQSTEAVAVIGACSFAGTMQTFILGGMSTGFGIYLCDCGEKRDAAWTAALCLTGLFGLLGIFLSVLSPLFLTLLRVPEELRPMALPYMRATVALSGAYSLRSLLIWQLQAQKQTAKSGILSAAGAVTQTLFTVLFIGALGLPVWSLPLAACLNHLLISAVIWRTRSSSQPPPLLLHFKEIGPDIWLGLLRGGSSKSGMKLLTGIGSLPKQLLLNKCAVGQIAGYTAAMAVSSVPQVILGAYGSCAAVLLGQWHSTGRRDFLKWEARRLFSHAAVTGTALTLLLFAFGKPILLAAVGNDAQAEVIEAGYLTLRVTSSGLIGLAVYCVGHFGLQGTGRFGVQLRFGVIAMLSQIITLALVFPRMGFTALPLSVLMSWLIPGLAALHASAGLLS